MEAENEAANPSSPSIPQLVDGSLDVCAGQASIQKHVNFIAMTQTHTQTHDTKA